jgi:hydroxyacylglutathione hydrolase
MLLKRFYDEPLAQASYMVGCQATGEAIIMDPLRDVDLYLQAAQAEGVRITHVTETHIHADFVSGARELARRAGATLLLSAEGGPDWRYGFAEEDGATLLRDGDDFKVGNILFQVMHTPGHTPDHLTFVVTDTAGADEPMGAFTGDFVFVGDVGRPDLLEKAAKVEGTMEAGARQLFQSLQRFRELPDWIQIWPGHGAGSACGKGLGAVPTSTLGYEKRFNWAFSHEREEDFVAAVLEGQPDPPRYFAEMKRINRDGPTVLDGKEPSFVEDEEEAASRLKALLDEGAVVVDTRPYPAFGGGHVPGTLNIPLNRSFTTMAGWILPYNRDLHLIVDDDETGAEAVRNLRGIGLDRVETLIPVSAVGAWARDGGKLEIVGRISADELEDGLESGEVQLLDVRWNDEWKRGRIPGAVHIPLGDLEERMDELPNGKPLVLTCASGARSAIAASLLQRSGVKEVANLEGGYARWASARKPVEEGARG